MVKCILCKHEKYLFTVSDHSNTVLQILLRPNRVDGKRTVIVL